MNVSKLASVGLWLLIGLISVACSGLPPIDQQKRLVQAGDLKIQQLTPRAFAETWGEPTYTHQQFTHFSACPMVN